MYLSKILLDPTSRATQKALSDVGVMHRSIMACFPDIDAQNAREELGVLFRLEVDRRGESVQVLVQSKVKPSWSFLPKGILVADNDSTGNPWCKQVDKYFKDIGDGDSLRFRLQANPTKKIRAGEGTPQGKRVELILEEQQLEWLRRRGSQSGFEVRSATLKPLGKITAGPSNGSGAAKKTLFVIRFDGVLRVTDHVALKEALEKGIGPGKAYGLGLLSVAP
jgi:CRISPR system Cascade subunit CasE